MKRTKINVLVRERRKDSMFDAAWFTNMDNVIRTNFDLIVRLFGLGMIVIAAFFIFGLTLGKAANSRSQMKMWKWGIVCLVGVFAGLGGEKFIQFVQELGQYLLGLLGV